MTVVVEKTGAPGTLKTRPPSKLVPEEKSILSDTLWGDLGGVVSDLTAFVPAERLPAVFGRIKGSYKATGDGGLLRVIQVAPDGTETDMKPTAFVLTDTGGDWAPFAFSTSVPPTAGDNTYILQGKLGGAVATAVVRYTSVTPLEVL